MIKEVTSDPDKLRLFILFLGDLCDSPNSLRGHLASACEDILQYREATGKATPKSEKRWREFLDE